MAAESLMKFLSCETGILRRIEKEIVKESRGEGGKSLP